MGRRLASGLVLAAVVALIIGLSDALGLDLQHAALLGAGLGGVLGLVPHPPDWGKLAGFGAGFVLAWIGYALRAVVLPDAAAGRAVAAFLVVALLTVIAVTTSGHVPLWSSLIGVAAVVGAYEEIYTNAPSQFLAESPAAVTPVLLTAALGYLATSLLAERQAVAGRTGARRPDGVGPRTTESGIDTLMRGE